MSFGFFNRPDINEGVKLFHNTKNAVLIDVREAEEYAQGHIPGSINVPLSRIHEALNVLGSRHTPVFVYCQSGGRSKQAAQLINGFGFYDTHDIGGFASYTGPKEP